MRMKEGYEPVEIMNEWVLVPNVSSRIQIDGLLTLSESGVFLWKQLSNEKSKDELVSSILEEYEVDRNTAELDVKKFIEDLDSKGLIQDDCL